MSNGSSQADVQVVRRLSLASFNAAIQNKPHLIIDKLNVLQPMLYQETVVRPELQREVQMGPWKGKLI
jgi:cullin-associated NEDD8-dissociated protein 1